MKHLMLKKIIASLTAVCLIAGAVPFTAFAAESEAVNETRIITGTKVDVSRPERETTAEQSTEAARFKNYEPDEMITAIVILDEPAAANYYNSAAPMSIGVDIPETMSAGKKLSTFLSSDEALRISEQNRAQQLDLVSKISALSLDNGSDNGIALMAMPANSVELIAQFTGIINAMSVRIPYGLLEQVNKLDGVKTAYVEKTYSIPKDEDLEPLVGGIERYSYAQSGVKDVWDAGFTGEGMVVAVLDTSLDIRYGSWYDYSVGDNVTGVRGCHEAFRDDSFLSEDPEVCYTKSSITKLISALGNNLVVEEYAPGSAENWYKTLKVPFAADYSHMYSDGRVDDNVYSDQDHGTHVSGTILGFSRTDDGAVKFSGVAPDAQLLFMKVFDDDGYLTSTTPLIAALNDVAYLGADVVNLSLGSDNGFATEDTAYQMFFEMLEEFGVIASISNGNSGHSQQSNSYTEGHPYAENPDVTMTGSPAIYDSVLAVASVNTEVYGAKYLIWNDGEKDHKIQYEDTGTYNGGYGDSYLFGEVNPGQLTSDNSVYNCGFGYQEDYEKYDWIRQDRIPPSYTPEINGEDSGFALVQRGTISFADKVLNAMKCNNYSNQVTTYNPSTYTSFPTQGLRGIIVYNNEPGYISMDLSGLGYRNNNSYPAISISQADGEEMAAAIAAGKNVTITFVNTEDEAGEWPVSPESVDLPGQVSSFSSWGGGPGLELKPDIAAPGGMVFSSIPDTSYDTDSKVGTYDDYVGNYDYMSGTSMAAPHISGISALVKQALINSGKKMYKGQPSDVYADYVEHLLVSTAVPIKATGEGYVSPRLQGAGLVNAGAAIKTPVYVDVAGENVGKLELMDDADWTGSFDFSIDLVNTTSEEHTYSAELVVMTPDMIEVNEKEAYADYDKVLSTTSLGNVTVSGGELTRTTFKGAVKYDVADIKPLSPNGTYIEGYLILTPVGEDLPALSVPFLGFAGDWTAAPIFDNIQWWEVSDGEGNYSDKLDDTVFIEPDVYGIFYGMVASYVEGLMAPTILGANPFDPGYYGQQLMNDGPYYEGNFTISPNNDGNIDFINYFELYQLRDAKVLMFQVYDKETGEVYYNSYVTDFPKTSFLYDDMSGVYIPYPSSLNLTNWGFAYGGEKVLDYDTDEKELLPDGTQLEFKIGAFGEGDYERYFDEYYGMYMTDADGILINDPDTWPTFNGHKMNMDGDIISFDLLIDTSAPELVGSAASLTKQDDGTYLFECKFDDGVGSIASVEIDPYLTFTVKDEYVEMAKQRDMNLVEHYMGDPIDFELIFDEDAHTYTYSCVLPNPETYTQEEELYDVTWDDGTFYVFCGDYGANDASYVFQINDEVTAEGELNAVWEYGELYEGEVAPITIIDNTGVEGAVTFTSSNEDVAIVDENGYVTAVGAGTAVITLEKADKTVTVVITVKNDISDITDFRFSVEDYATLIPGQAITIRIEDIVPYEYNGENAPVIEDCSWEIFDPNWEYYEDELYDDTGDPFELTVNDIPGREYYQKEATISFSSDALVYEPGTEGYAILTVTLNGCTKSTRIYYEIPEEEDYLTTGEYSQEMIKYIELGESADAIAMYVDIAAHQPPRDKIQVRVCTAEGYNWDEVNWSGSASTEESEGLYVVPSSGDAGSYYEGYICAKPGYDLPKYEDVHVGNYNITGDYYTPRINQGYKQWDYDETTGKIWVDNLPYSTDSVLIITADGVPNDESQGTTPPPDFVIPSEGETGEVDGLYGPFNWTVFSLTNAMSIAVTETPYGTITENDDYANSVTFTPNAPGMYRLTATNKAGTSSVSWIIVVSDKETDGSITLQPDTEGAEGIEGIKYSVILSTSSNPTQLVLKAYDENGNEIDLPDDLIWETSDGSVVTVDENGVVTVVGPGVATITVKSASNQSVNAHFVIKVDAEHEHDLVWRYDSSKHWQVCLNGDYTGEASHHEFVGSVCVVCDYIAPYAQPRPYPSYTESSVNVEFTVVDENGNPVPSVTLTLGGASIPSTTGADGKAYFSGVRFGNHTVELGDVSVGFNIVLGTAFGINGTTVTAVSGNTVSITLVYSNGSLRFAGNDNNVDVEVPTEAPETQEDDEEGGDMVVADEEPSEEPSEDENPKTGVIFPIAAIIMTTAAAAISKKR